MAYRERLTEEEINLIGKWWPHHSTEMIAKVLNTTAGTVKNHAKKLREKSNGELCSEKLWNPFPPVSPDKQFLLMFLESIKRDIILVQYYVQIALRGSEELMDDFSPRLEAGGD